jgi:hypothetical protein
MKRKRDLMKTKRTTVASIEKEMQMPRSTESVRNDRRYQAELTAEKVAEAGKSLSLGKFPMKDDSDPAWVPTRFASRNPS